jgi:hypothetical protein
MYTIFRISRDGDWTNLTTCGKKSDTSRPLEILARSHLMDLRKAGVDAGLDGSLDVSWVRIWEGGMES